MRDVELTEKKKMSEILQEQLASQQKEIASLKTQLEKLSTTSTPEKYDHEHSANVKFSCPDCQKAYDAEVSKKVLADKRAKIKSMKNPQLCEDCGEIYDAEKETGEWNDECPTCRGKTE